MLIINNHADLTMGESFRLATDEEVAALIPRLDHYLAPAATLIEFVELVPFVDTSRLGGTGCSSGHVPYVPGSRQQMYVTINDPHGCAQGCWHEYGHLKLEAMGIGIETHDNRMLLNPPDERYDSAIRRDCKRPMSAVLHGLYAWLQFTQNDYELLTTERIDLAEFRTYAAHNLPKILANATEMRRFARWTMNGTIWANEIYLWATTLCAKGTAILQ